MKRDFDVAVVGAGPAGSVAAREVTRLGLGRVLLLERATMPRHKTCAGGISPKASALLQDIDLWHLVRDVPEDATTVPIGLPLANTTAYVLDRARRPVPVGVPGELYLGGDGLAVEYLNAPELNAERFIPAPFRVRISEAEIPGTVEALRSAGLDVDTSWEVARLVGLAASAQAQTRYFGRDGDDVRGFAERAAALEPESQEARSLLLKVAERMAWDAEAALQDDAPDVAEALVRECLSMLPDHPGCIAAGGEG